MENDKTRVIDAELRLIPYYTDYALTLPWYQDADVCRQCDNIDHPYTRERLEDMYTFLNAHGDCFYIEYRGQPVGDITLRDNGEVCIVICREFQNRHIGRRCAGEIIHRAKEKGFDAVTANIYSFNTQSRKMFLSAGFIKTDEERYEYRIDQGEEDHAEPEH